ncbi:MAG TPA: hypothetical protein VNN07_01785 [Candidatus Tectomicrobia bacterium]|nr:hypothetical protein [Candidatus Tectomicrobia bacterium]
MPAAIAAAVDADVAALLVVASAVPLAHPSRVVDAVARHRLAAIYPFHEFADARGLVSYGESLHRLVRRTAAQVDRLLKGARPSDIPVERPARLDLVVNLTEGDRRSHGRARRCRG